MTLQFKLCGISLLLALMLLAPQRTAAWSPAECSRADPSGRDFDMLVQGKSRDFGMPAQRKSVLNTKSQCMSLGERAVPKALLDEDESIIEDAYPAIRDFYVTKKHREEDVARIVSLAWTRFRWKNQSDHMDTRTFIQLSTSYGQLTIKSDPVGASIIVDAKPWDDPTNRTDWTEAGERSVKLTKKSCKPEEGKVTVPAGASATFERKLNCD